MKTYDDKLLWEQAKDAVIECLTIDQILSMPDVLVTVEDEVHNDICEEYDELEKEQA